MFQRSCLWCDSLIALVIGVSDYGGQGNLANLERDARATAETLERLGYDVRIRALACAVTWTRRSPTTCAGRSCGTAEPRLHWRCSSTTAC
ncbi:caspase family protein [Bosea thiooxidans]